MDVAAPAPPDDQSPIQQDTFCQYLAKQFIAKQSFTPGAPVQAAEIAGLFACMLVLSPRFPKGEIRARLQMNAIYVLVPSMRLGREGRRLGSSAAPARRR